MRGSAKTLVLILSEALVFNPERSERSAFGLRLEETFYGRPNNLQRKADASLRSALENKIGRRSDREKNQ